MRQIVLLLPLSRKTEHYTIVALIIGNTITDHSLYLVLKL